MFLLPCSVTPPLCFLLRSLWFSQYWLQLSLITTCISNLFHWSHSREGAVMFLCKSCDPVRVLHVLIVILLFSLVNPDCLGPPLTPHDPLYFPSFPQFPVRTLIFHFQCRAPCTPVICEFSWDTLCTTTSFCLCPSWFVYCLFIYCLFVYSLFWLSTPACTTTLLPLPSFDFLVFDFCYWTLVYALVSSLCTLLPLITWLLNLDWNKDNVFWIIPVPLLSPSQ